MKTKLFLIGLLLVIAIAFQGTVYAGTIETKYDVTMYGKIKADLAIDDSDLMHNNFSSWVMPETTGGPSDVGAMNITASETRLGFKFAGPDYEDMVTNGLLEVDFFDNALGEDKAAPYMRHAHASVTWTEMDLTLLAGQAFDIIAPLNPTTLNYSPMYWQGNVSFRRPQFRITKGIEASEDVNIKLQLALARNIGNNLVTSGGGYTTLNSGADNESPIIEYRAGVSSGISRKKKTTIGLSGAMGSQTVYTNAAATLSTDYDVEIMALDLAIPLAEGVTLKGEYWTGKNVSTFNGGVGQGVNYTPTTGIAREIEADGYWAALGYTFAEDWNVNIGMGVDDPDDADLNAGGRAENSIIYANVIYTLNEAVKVGLEIADMETKYKGTTPSADNTRIQTSFIYMF